MDPKHMSFNVNEASNLFFHELIQCQIKKNSVLSHISFNDNIIKIKSTNINMWLFLCCPIGGGRLKKLRVLSIAT